MLRRPRVSPNPRNQTGHLYDIVAFWKTGHNFHGSVFGTMSDVVINSTQYMTDSDLKAVALYLKSLPASANGATYNYDPAQANARGNPQALIVRSWAFVGPA